MLTSRGVTPDPGDTKHVTMRQRAAHPVGADCKYENAWLYIVNSSDLQYPIVRETMLQGFGRSRKRAPGGYENFLTPITVFAHLIA